MKKIISFTTAVNIALMQYGAITIFHLCIILGILLFNFAPIDYLWGGRMETKEELLNFEIVSFLVMIFCIF
ncbi:MAG: hypothetical protein KDK36_11760, partial [Leptospiraceae bacterium]|nr:hypothetical protein [Leptospiraceae bacterium]